MVANDADSNRSYTLVHQVKRLQSPCFMVTNHDATIFPTLQRKNNDQESQLFQFDRILADVPCSGDGTIRKNPTIWSKWAVNQGNGLHAYVSDKAISTPHFIGHKLKFWNVLARCWLLEVVLFIPPVL